MLLRVALVLLLLVGVFAASYVGVSLPWDTATTTSEQAAKAPESAPDQQQAAIAEKAPEAAPDSPQKAIEEAKAALDTKPEAATAPGSVALDISRISPDGPSVFAGRADPDTYVTVMEDGKAAGTVKADTNGEWSLSTEHKFASTDPNIKFETSKTPPPEPPKVAAVKPAPPTAASVAGDVMRKFENLVSEAREEAKKRDDEPAETATAEPAPSEPATAAPNTETAAAAPDAGSTSEATSDATSSNGAAAGAHAEKPAHADTATSSSTSSDKAASATVTAEAAPQADTPEPGSTEAIPVPIMFVYNEAVLTPEGQRAASLLLEYLTLKRLSAVELTGHADERGTNEYNYDLSRDRLETVSHILREGGYSGELKLTPKGKSEPYAGVDRTAYSGEALFQFDRRVELRVTR